MTTEAIRNAGATEENPRVRLELWAIVAGVFSLLLFFALVSFRSGQPGANWIGPVGSFVADTLYFSLGAGAFGVVGLTGWLCWSIARGRPVMERTGATPLPPAFFRALETCADRLKLFSLEVDGVDHGAYIYLLDDEQHTLQHLFTAVTEASFEVHAPELLHAHALEWGIDQGYDSYELRGAPADYRNGVFRFKSLFGADPRPVIIWERGRPAPALQGIDLARQLYRKFRG